MAASTSRDTAASSVSKTAAALGESLCCGICYELLLDPVVGKHNIDELVSVRPQIADQQRAVQQASCCYGQDMLSWPRVAVCMPCCPFASELQQHVTYVLLLTSPSQVAVDMTSASAAWTCGEVSSGSKATTGSSALSAVALLQNHLTSWVSSYIYSC
jgi:hypothetical protein